MIRISDGKNGTRPAPAWIATTAAFSLYNRCRARNPPVFTYELYRLVARVCSRREKTYETKEIVRKSLNLWATLNDWSKGLPAACDAFCSPQEARELCELVVWAYFSAHKNVYTVAVGEDYFRGPNPSMALSYVAEDPRADPLEVGIPPELVPGAEVRVVGHSDVRGPGTRKIHAIDEQGMVTLVDDDGNQSPGIEWTYLWFRWEAV